MRIAWFIRCAGAFLATLLCARAAASEEERFFRVHPLGFVEIETAEAAAQAIVGPGGSVIPDRRNQRLLVRATEPEHRRLAEALAAINRPPVNVRIDVDFDEAGDAQQRGIGITTEGVFHSNQGGSVAIGVNVADRSTRFSGRARQTLVVASGREATLRVGERVPWLEWIETWGRNAGVFESRVHWQDVGAFLVVQPTVIGTGPDIRIRLIPELSGRVEGQPHRIRFAAAATEVIARDGETVSLAGLAQANEFYSRFLVGFDSTGGRRSLNISLTPSLLPATTPR